MFELLREAGIDPATMSVPRRENMGTPDELVDVTVDISGYVDQKLAAIMAHRTQIAKNSPWALISAEASRPLFSREFFVLGSGPGARAG
jgi:N-acetyl-1-D-myo-inositol-2-amino-2-deoxy-alpha-D-glucopyranoside deacetylase